MKKIKIKSILEFFIAGTLISTISYLIGAETVVEDIINVIVISLFLAISKTLYDFFKNNRKKDDEK